MLGYLVVLVVGIAGGFYAGKTYGAKAAADLAAIKNVKL